MLLCWPVVIIWTGFLQGLLLRSSDALISDNKALNELSQHDETFLREADDILYHQHHQYHHLPDHASRSHTRVKRQLTYFVLKRVLGKEGIRTFVRNTKPESMASMINTVGPAEILLIVSSLEDDQIMRVLLALPPASILDLSKKMTSAQLMELLSYVPVKGLADLTASFSPEELQKLVVLLPPEGIVNMTKALPPEHTLKLIRSIPPDIFVNMTQTLPPEILTELMNALPPESMVPVLTSLPPESIRQLVSGLPLGFLESFISDLSPEQLGQIVENVTDQQMMKLLLSFPVEYAPNVTTLLQPEIMNAVLDSMPKDLVGNLTTLLPPKTLSSMMAAIPQDKLLLVTSMVSAKQVVDILKPIPPKSWSILFKAFPAERLLAVATSLPVDKIANITTALAEHPQVISGMLRSVMSSNVNTNISVPFPQELVWEILERLPNETIGKLAAALPVKAAFGFAQSFSSGPAGLNVTQLLTDAPKPLLIKLAASVPPEVVANLSTQLSSNQLKKMVRLVTPDILKYLMTTIPVKVMVDITMSLPESVMIKVLQVLSPQHFRNMVKAVPVATIKSLVTEMMSQGREGVSKDVLQAGSQKIANILNSVPPETLTRLIKAIPRDVLVDVIDALPADVMARGAALLSGEEGGAALMGAIPLEVAAYAVSIIPPESITKMVDAVPKSTLAAFGSQATRIPQERISSFFQMIRVGTLKTIITRLPPRTIEKLLGSIPPGVVGRMAQSFSPTTVTPFVQSLKARDLRRLIRSVNTSTLTNLVTSIPQDVIVNLTMGLPGPQLRKVIMAVPPVVIGHLVNYLHPEAVVSLMKAMPPEAVEHMMKMMPADLLVNMTRFFPPSGLQEMIDVLPGNTIGRIVSLLPPDVMAGLVQTFDPEALLGMIKKLEPEQLLEILSKMPHQVILNMTLSQTPEQTLALLRSVPPGGVVNLTRVIPNDVMLQMMQAVPPEALLGFLSSIPLKDVFLLAAQLTPEQMTLAMEQMTSDPDLLPNLMTSFDLDRLVSMTEAVPFDLLMQISSRLNVATVQDILHRLLPKGKQFAGDLVDRGVAALGRNSSQTFQECLRDVGTIAHAMLNFTLSSFHFLDASGKPGRGMLEGNIHMFGNYDQCKRIRHVVGRGSREGDVITGSYCHVQFDIPLEHLPPIPGEGMLPMPEIAIDLCVPDSCQDFDIYNLLRTVRLPKNMSIPRVSCQRDLHIAQDPPALVACTILFLLLLLLIVGTVVDHLSRRRFASIYSSDSDSDHRTQSSNDSKFPAEVVVAACKAEGVLNGVGSHPLNGAKKGGCGSVVTDEDACCNEKLLTPMERVRMAGDRTVSEMQRLMTRRTPSPSDHSAHGEPRTVHKDPKPEDGCCRGGGVVEDSVSTSMENTTDQPLWQRAMTSFSVCVTLRGLTSPPRGGNQEEVTCLHGIRVLTMLWIILSNTVIFSALYFENLMHAANELITLPAQIVLNSSLAQDTFFLLSGLVTTLSFYRSLSAAAAAAAGVSGVTLRHVLRYYLRRFLRLWPAYSVVVMVSACLLSYLAEGPHWPPALQAQCRQQWWANLLFVNNYLVSVEHMCLSWTWFVDNLMQFHWIAPLVLLPWALGFKVIGCILAGLLVIVHIVSTAFIEVHINGDFLREQSEYLWRVYQQPYCRVAPFAIGLVLGWGLLRIHFQCRLSKVTVCLCWGLCLGLSSLLAFVTYDENRHLLVDASGWPLVARALHETVQHPLWALVVAWVVFACSTGNGGAINRVLSWRGFVPISRLSYCVYLVHPLLILSDLLAYRVFAYFTMAYVIFRYVSYVVVSYLLALGLYAVSESPVRGLERALFSSRAAPLPSATAKKT